MNIADLTNEDINKHQGMVYKLAGKYFRQVHDPAIDFDDLLSEANLALVRSYERFDPDKGFAFSTFAYKTISGYLQAYLDRTGAQIRFPAHTVLLGNKIYRLDLVKAPVGEIAEKLQVSERQVHQALNYLRQRDTSSLDVPKRDMLQGVYDGDSDMYDLVYSEDDLSTILAEEFLVTLKDKDREVLEMRMQGYNRRQIGRMLDCSHQAIWQRLQKLKRSYTKFEAEERIG